MIRRVYWWVCGTVSPRTGLTLCRLRSAMVGFLRRWWWMVTVVGRRVGCRWTSPFLLFIVLWCLLFTLTLCWTLSRGNGVCRFPACGRWLVVLRAAPFGRLMDLLRLLSMLVMCSLWILLLLCRFRRVCFTRGVVIVGLVLIALVRCRLCRRFVGLFVWVIVIRSVWFLCLRLILAVMIRRLGWVTLCRCRMLLLRLM